MDNTTIDLNRAQRATSSLIDDQQRHEYQSTTLRKFDTRRTDYLPMFPTIFSGRTEDLLLSNIPIQRLEPHEILRRQHAAYTSDALMLMEKYYQDIDPFNISMEDIKELSQRFQVAESIITFNASRLCSICHRLLMLHESFRQRMLLEKDVALKEPTLNSKQMAIVLEFYLQIDSKSHSMDFIFLH